MDAEFWPRHPSKITATSSPGHLFTIKGKRKRDYFLKIAFGTRLTKQLICNLFNNKNMKPRGKG